jgi:hypothetical protein
MKKLILILTTILILAPVSYGEQSGDNTIALLTKNGFFDTTAQVNYTSPYVEIRKVLCTHLKYANSYNLDGLKTLYADNYINTDGLSRDIYFDLIKKTWDSYPDIKYTIDIKNIEIDADHAVAQVIENAIAATNAKSGIIHEKGILQSTSSSVYYFEKINNKWLITSDHIISEKTMLKYGVANDVKIDLIAPSQIYANTPYTASLDIQAPRDSLVIASIGKEDITYPQVLAEEVFRKLSDDGTLERVFKSNNKNINEYAVASFGITKAKIINQSELKIYVTGLGFAMSRVNVIPKNEFITVAKDSNDAKDVKSEKIEKSEKNDKKD